MAATNLDLLSRIAGLQIAISRITSLSLASLNALDGLSPIEPGSDRQIIAQVTDFADLIIELARGLGNEADEIESDIARGLGVEA